MGRFLLRNVPFVVARDAVVSDKVRFVVNELEGEEINRDKLLPKFGVYGFKAAHTTSSFYFPFSR